MAFFTSLKLIEYCILKKGNECLSHDHEMNKMAIPFTGPII